MPSEALPQSVWKKDYGNFSPVFLWQRFYIQYAKEVFFCKANIWLHTKKDSVILKKIGQTSEGIKLQNVSQSVMHILQKAFCYMFSGLVLAVEFLGRNEDGDPG